MDFGINDGFDEIHEGDRLSARWLNSLAGSVSRMSRPNRGRMRTLSNACGLFTIPEDEHGLLFFNGDATTIPAYGVVLSNGVKAAGGPDFVPQVKRPDGYGCQRNFYVNGPNSVSGEDFGEAQFGDGNVFIAAWDTTDGFTPAKGEMWGVQSGSYLIRKNYAGFRVEGVYDSTNHWVLARSEPCYTIRGKPTPSSVPSGSSSTLAIYTGAFGSEAQPAGNPTILNVRNDSSCTISVKISTIRYNPDNQGWQWTDAYTQ